MRFAGSVQACGTMRAGGPRLIRASMAPGVRRAVTTAATAAAGLVGGHPCTWRPPSPAVATAQTLKGACGVRAAA